MRKLVLLCTLVFLFFSCRKTESDFIWEKSFGQGEALYLSSSPDSGYFASGEVSGKPFFIRLDKNNKKIIEFESGNSGSFSAAWFDTSGYITGGSSNGKMLLMRHSPLGNLLWEQSYDPGFIINKTNLINTGDGTFLAIGTAAPDSSISSTYGLLFVRFDTTGQLIDETRMQDTKFVAASSAAMDNEGNLFLALTRVSSGSKPKASVAKYNSTYQKLWETELYNNPDFGAASMAIRLGSSGNVFVAGKTELSGEDGFIINSFTVSLSNSGSILWKRYLENSNSGSYLIFDDSGNLMMLNMNCFIVNILNPDDGSDAGRIKTLSICDSYNTNILSSAMCIHYDKNLLLSGTKGGSFYLALKSFQ